VQKNVLHKNIKYFRFDRRKNDKRLNKKDLRGQIFLWFREINLYNGHYRTLFKHSTPVF